jgi:indole-3-glycerol phosphate synthase / phosphoribosylanthranilate isomerase
MNPLVKICGLKRVEDAELALGLGATHVGVVKTESSPRAASVEEARAIFEVAKGRATTVLVCRDLPIDDVARDAKASGCDWVQLYGALDSDVERLEDEGFRVLRVHDMSESSGALPVLAPEPTERRPALLDVGGGGSGRRFDWALLGESAPAFTWIAGGIRPDNVEELLAHRPHGLDLASGVESAPGVKDRAKLTSLFTRIETFLTKDPR